MDSFVFTGTTMVLFTIFLLSAPTQAGSQTETPSQPPADEELMEKVREMFASPYQEEDYYRTDRLLITATGSQKPVFMAPSVATVITAADIERMGITTLDEALETVPGLHVLPSNKNRFTSSYSLRGIHTSINPQVLLMVDGHPVRDAYSGGRPPVFHLPVSFISRIEVVRGPVSALHGADAVSGTINIITKDRFEIEDFKSGFGYGSFDTANFWLQHGGTYRGWDMALGLEYLKTDGDQNRSVTSDQQTVLDGLLGTAASETPGPLSLNYEIIDAHISLVGENWTVRCWGWLNRDAGMGLGVTDVLAAESMQNDELYRTELDYQNSGWLPGWQMRFNAAYEYQNMEAYAVVFPPKAVIPIEADGNIGFNLTGFTYFPDGTIGIPAITQQTVALKYSAGYEGTARHKMLLETGYVRNRVDTSEQKNFGPGVLDGTQAVSDGQLTDVTDTPDIFMADQRREVVYVLLQDEWNFKRHWELTAGVRFDEYSDFGNTLTPRAALVWETRSDLTTKLMYGRAFRPPSLTELYAQNNPANNGNPALEPETIEALEFALDYQPLHNFRTVLNFYAYEIIDLIELVQDPGVTTQTSRNAKDQEGHGVELQTDWDIIANTLSLKASLAYQRSRDKKTAAIIPDAPELQFYANINWQFRRHWSVDGQYYWIGKRHRAPGDTRPDVKDNDIVNITLRRQEIFKNWELTLATRNLFDEDVREPNLPVIADDTPMEGRSGWIELRCHY